MTEVLTTFAENLEVCHRCSHRMKECVGQCPCLADSQGRDIIEMAQSGECPRGMFGTLFDVSSPTSDIVRAVENGLAPPNVPARWNVPPNWQSWGNVKRAYAETVSAFVKAALTCKVIHAYDGVVLNNHPDEKRNLNAKATWGGENVTLLPFSPVRDATDLGGARDLAYINDLFDWACLNAKPDDVIVWTNGDICVAEGFYDRIREALAWQDAAYTRRVDVDDASAPPEEYADNFGPGVDCIAFRPHWWRALRAEMPEMFIATHAFDIVLAELVDRTSRVPEITPRITYHERHGWSWWKTHSSDASRLHNDREWRAVRPASQMDRVVGVPYARRVQGEVARLRQLIWAFPVQSSLHAELDDATWVGHERLRKYEPPLVVAEPGNHGDLLGLLPGLKYLHQQGRKVTYVCTPGHEEFAEGLDWLDVKVERLPADDTAAKYGQVLKVVVPARNWALKSWGRLGLSEELYYSLPLEVENRRPDKEAELVASLNLPAGRAVILFNADGFSSPYEEYDKQDVAITSYGRTLFDRLRTKYKGCHWVDIGKLQAEKFRDLLGLFERAELLLTIDTGTLHLGYATKTPTIALLNDCPHLQSEPRPHWKLWMTYKESKTEVGMKEIEAAIGEVLIGNRAPVPLAKRLAHGALGVAKATAGLGGATEEQVRERLKVCVGCDKYVRTLGFPQCQVCGCFLEAKVRNLDEHCPMGKW